jgi:hypothetical protein
MLSMVNAEGTYVDPDVLRFHFQKTNRTMEVNLSAALAIKTMDPSFNQYWDGMIGLAPWNTLLGGDKTRNFMTGLKENGIIDHMVVSIYIREHSGNSSHIKFGSYDPHAHVGELLLFRTKYTNQWVLNAKNFKIEDGASSSGDKELLIAPHLAHFYLPDEEFTAYVANPEKWDGDLTCSSEEGMCYYNTACGDIDKDHSVYFHLRFTIWDLENTTGYDLSIPVVHGFYIHGEELGLDANKCVLPIFKSSSVNQNRFVMGSNFLSYFYTVLDQTPRLEGGEDFNVIGLGAINFGFNDHQVGSAESPDSSVIAAEYIKEEE